MSHHKIERRLIALTILAIGLATLWIPTSYAQQKSNPETKHTNRSQPDKRGTPNNPVAVDIVATEKDEQATAQEQKDRGERRRVDEWLIGVGIVQSGVFLLQFIAFIIQARFTRDTVNEMKEGTKATLRIATTAKENAAQTIDTMECNTEKQLRAYVMVDVDELLDSETGWLRAEVKIRNFGQTPAHNFIHITGLLVAPSGASINLENMGGFSRAILAPGQTIIAKTKVKTEFTSEIRKEVEAGTSMLYLVVEIFYHDAFGKERWTTYRAFRGGIHSIKDGSMVRDSTDNDYC